MTALSAQGCEPQTTSGAIAMINLQAQIQGLQARGHLAGPGRTVALAAAEAGVLIDLLTLRGHVLGSVADYERAAGLAERLVRDRPGDPTFLLYRGRTCGTLHRFSEALTDLDAAERSGAEQDALDAERAAILQAIGSHGDALVLRNKAAKRRRDVTSLGALAVLQAGRGEAEEAERLFAEALRSYRDVSPFPVASLEFRRGLMWLKEGSLPEARKWFDAARRRVPAYAPAQGHLAEVDAALGARWAAIERLRPLALSSDDPDYAASLARVLRDVGHAREADQWRVRAAARYHQLMLRHPAAYAHHAAEFWLGVGGDQQKGLGLARRDRVARETARANALLHHTY